MRLQPTQQPERLGMQVPGPGDQETLENARTSLGDAYRSLYLVVKKIDAEPFQDSPAQISVHAALVAVRFAGKCVADALNGSRKDGPL